MLSAERRAQAARSVRARRFTEDQPRDPDGRFASGEGESDGKLTDDEIRAVNNYTGSSYISINEALRGVTADPSTGIPYVNPVVIGPWFDPKTVANMGHPYNSIPQLDSAIDKQPPLAEPMTVTRELYLGSPDAAKQFLKDHASGSFTDRGFVSTSIGDSRAWPKDPESGGIKVTIDLPAGTKGLNVVDKVPTDNLHDLRDQEHEFLLPRGCSFTVDKAKWNAVTGGTMHLVLNLKAAS